MRKHPLALGITALCALAGARFTPAAGGAAVVRITDGITNRCINPAKDMVWLTLRRVITQKKSGWLVQDKSVEAIFKAQVRSPAKPLSFPLSAETTLKGFTNGQVSVPIEYTIVDGFRLKQSGVTYSGIQLDMILLNLQKKNGWGRGLQTLAEVAKSLPLPNSPLTQSATYLLDFANTAVDKDIADVAADDKANSASLALNFDPSGKCSAAAPNGSDFEKTGTIAVIQDRGETTGFVVPVNDVNNYCWTAELKPSFVLKAAKKDATACTDIGHYGPLFKQVTNDYVGFFLNGIETTDQLADTEQGKIDRQLAVQRCTANGTPAADCLKRRP